MRSTCPKRLELAGDRVLIDRTAWVLAKPRRWDVIAFRHPSAPDGLAVKRVAGLPGELIQVRQGDVYADGKIRRKTLRQQRAVRVLVYDADFRPRIEPTPPARWYGRTEASGWERVGGRLAHDSGPAGRPIDWLVYGHWRRSGRPGEVVATPIADVCGYNQDRPRREESVRPVRDVMLSVRIGDVFGRGLLWLWATDGWQQFDIRLDPQDRSYTVGHRRAAGQARSSIVPPGLGNLHIAHLPSSELLGYCQSSLRDGETHLSWGRRNASVPPGRREPRQRVQHNEPGQGDSPIFVGRKSGQSPGRRS